MTTVLHVEAYLAHYRRDSDQLLDWIKLRNADISFFPFMLLLFRLYFVVFLLSLSLSL